MEEQKFKKDFNRHQNDGKNNGERRFGNKFQNSNSGGKFQKNDSGSKFQKDGPNQRSNKFDNKDQRGQQTSSASHSFSKYDQSKDVEEFPKRTQSPKKRFSSSSFLDPIEHDDFAEHELTKRRNKNRYENKKKKRNRYDDDFDDFGWN